MVTLKYLFLTISLVLSGLAFLFWFHSYENHEKFGAALFACWAASVFGVGFNFLKRRIKNAKRGQDQSTHY